MEHLKHSSQYNKAHSRGLKGLNWGFPEYKQVPTTNLCWILKLKNIYTALSHGNTDPSIDETKKTMN
jgi:hypothetical protein